MSLHTAAQLAQPVSEELLQRPCLWGRSPAPSRTSSSRGFQHANMLVVSRLYTICGLVDVEVSAHVVDALHHHSVTGRSFASQRAAEAVCDGLPSDCVAVMLSRKEVAVPHLLCDCVLRLSCGYSRMRASSKARGYLCSRFGSLLISIPEDNPTQRIERRRRTRAEEP